MIRRPALDLLAALGFVTLILLAMWRPAEYFGG